MGATVNVVRQSPYTLAQHGRNVVEDIIDQMYWLTALMSYLAEDNCKWHCNLQGYVPTDSMRVIASTAEGWYQEAELSRLVIIIGTPEPTAGPHSTSASTNWHAISGTITKDALLLALEAIVQSADAFPPLKSAASGLLFFATCADVSIRSVHALSNRLSLSTSSDCLQ